MYKLKSTLLVFILMSVVGCGKERDLASGVVSKTKKGASVCLSEVGCKTVTATKRTLQTIPGFTHSDTSSYTVASDSNGDFYVGGVINSDAGNGKGAYIVKFDTSTETVDSNFGVDGVVKIDTANAEIFHSVSLSSDEKSIFGVGTNTVGAAQPDFLVGKFNTSTGSLDTTFSGDGKIIQNYPQNWYDSANYVGEFSDGSVYTCGMTYKNGTTGYDAVVSKYSSSGVLEPLEPMDIYMLILAVMRSMIIAIK